MAQNGYIKLFRAISEWEWYKDSNTKNVFIHYNLKVYSCLTDNGIRKHNLCFIKSKEVERDAIKYKIIWQHPSVP